MNALRVDSISKNFGNFKAVDDLSLEVPKGSVFGLLGPNGAGKTTTIRMAMGIILPDSGSISVFGSALTESSKEKIGYLPEERGLYKKMKVGDVLSYLCEIKGVGRREAKKSTLSWVERLGLEEWTRASVQDLSRGMQQKLQFISTIAHDPDLIVLDEPFTGLDPINTGILKDVMLELNKKKGKTIILSTHLMEQVERMCDGICLINRGTKVLDGVLSEVKGRYGHKAVVMEYDGEGDFLSDLPGVEKVNDYGKYVELRLKDDGSHQAVLKEAVSRVAVRRFELMEPSLNDIFIDMVGAENGVSDVQDRQNNKA
jgi:ABC-2 type transport system ATP-binding protein